MIFNSSRFSTLLAITSLASCSLFRINSTVRGFGLSFEKFPSILSPTILPRTTRVCRIEPNIYSAGKMFLVFNFWIHDGFLGLEKNL